MKKFLVIVSVFILLLAAGAGWVWWEDRPTAASEQVFRIPAGQGLSAAAERLGEAGLIRSPVLFRVFFQYALGGVLPSGVFEVPGGLSAWEAAAYFKTAQPVQIRVTIPEGWTSSKIARLLEEKSIVPASDFLAVVRDPSLLGVEGEGLSTLEGRLFPDTYQFPLETPAPDVARVFLKTFADKTAAWKASFSAEEWERRVVLASIVEREYREPTEAPVIASVFLNRLEHSIALGSCATIEYILTEIMGRPHPKRIFIVHTQIPSPFNTYLNKGLPPAAISNPGLTALRAAFEPAETNYLYFVVADPARGTHTFSSNFAGHEKARETYLNTFVTKG